MPGNPPPWPTARPAGAWEILDGRVAAPRGAAAQHVLEDVVAVARARHVIAMKTTGPIFANISRSTASDTLGYNHKPTGEP